MAPQDLDRLTLAQLRDLAAKHAIGDAGKLKKPDLIAALAKATGVSGPGRMPDEPSAPHAGSSGVAEQRPAPSRGPDPGLPIPDRYGKDRLVLMVQDPFHVFAYWEISQHTLDAARAACGEQGTPVLVLHTGSGAEQREVDLRGGNYYLSVAPNATYEAQIALRDSKGRLHALARSNRVATPAATVSARRDEQWMSVDDAFGELLEMAGLPNAGQGGSAARLAEQNRQSQQWVWETKDERSPAMSSAMLQMPAASSSGNLSSWSHSSASLVREREAQAQREHAQRERDAAERAREGERRAAAGERGEASSGERTPLPGAPNTGGFPE